MDLERLKRRRDIVVIPLFLHGTSDAPDEPELGINKANIATDLKISF